MADSKRKERAAARRVAQRATAEAWRALVDLHFGYLRTTFGFRITSTDASSVWVTRVIYQTDVAAVTVERSVEFERVELSVSRLVHGRLPEYPVFILPDTVINQTVFDNILAIRNPTLLDRLRGLKGLGDDQIANSLVFLARALEEAASDFLAGDLSIFGPVDKLLKERAKAHPPTITVYLPEDATADREAAAIDAARKNSPGIQVVARRYHRPAPRTHKNAANSADTSP